MGRVFGLLAAVVALGLGMYVYSRQVRSSSDAAGANNPKAAINITGVKADLISIATSERRYYATEGKYASLDELISADYISVGRQRPPYSYEIESSSGGFRVVATRSGDDGSALPAQLSVDDTMEFKTTQ
jgi:hypothetical protein